MQQENETKTASLGNTESAAGPTISTDQLAQTGTEEAVPTPVLTPEAVIEISDEEMRSVASEIGLTRWRPERMRALARLGDYLRNCGAVRVTSGEIAFSNEVRLLAISECQKRLSSTKDPEDFCMILSQFNALLNAKDAASKQINDLMKTGLIKEPEMNSGPKLPPKGVAVQVNIQNNAIAAKSPPE